MELTISHDRQQETPEAKARWFQSLSLAERIEFLCTTTDLVLENNPQVLKRKQAQPTSGRACILGGQSSLDPEVETPH
jgi:hypothetical protein